MGCFLFGYLLKPDDSKLRLRWNVERQTEKLKKKNATHRPGARASIRAWREKNYNYMSANK